MITLTSVNSVRGAVFPQNGVEALIAREVIDHGIVETGFGAPVRLVSRRASGTRWINPPAG
ncbi:hypothetical protein [Bradyrhizobium sp.]|uniref:hypothetical protein n=1 Tax=Bradyrhizobium sp. TaxID=376 RepID=UPI001D40E2FA|nr:hypothetical protein [Bradyrhizobium sp.]MBV8701028.1 hypothetical protein [Bradyrhizobium sp.]MBV9980443.1 hypothetical protein [Bradyrhizobium sp.]